MCGNLGSIRYLGRIWLREFPNWPITRNAVLYWDGPDSVVLLCWFLCFDILDTMLGLVIFEGYNSSSPHRFSRSLCCPEAYVTSTPLIDELETLVTASRILAKTERSVRTYLNPLRRRENSGGESLVIYHSDCS